MIGVLRRKLTIVFMHVIATRAVTVRLLTDLWLGGKPDAHAEGVRRADSQGQDQCDATWKHAKPT